MPSDMRLNWLVAAALAGTLLYLLAPVLTPFIAAGQLFGFFGILLALPAAAVLSVIVRFAYHRYLKEHPDRVIEPDVPPDTEAELE